MADRLPQPLPHQTGDPDGLERFPMSAAEAYRQWLFHGPLFQGITEIEGISTKGMAAICTTSSPRRCLMGEADGRWLIDPVVFDSGLQLIILWARAHRDMTPLPSRFRRYRRFGSFAGPSIRCHLQANAASDGHAVHANLFFIGADGSLLGVLEDLECNSSKALNRLAGQGGD
jgi:hypothetical protein